MEKQRIFFFLNLKENDRTINNKEYHKRWKKEKQRITLGKIEREGDRMVKIKNKKGKDNNTN